MKVLYLLIILCGMMTINIRSQALSNISMKKGYSAILRGEVKSIEIKSITTSDVKLIINLGMELLNNGTKPVLFLEANPPELRGAALAKKPEEFSTPERLVLEYYGESVDTSSKWSTLRNVLNQSSPPKDKIRALMPNESWKWDGTIDITLPQKSGNNNFSDKRENWEYIKNLPNTWLQVSSQNWSLNLEEKGSNRAKLVFGKMLQKRWKKNGLLWLEDIKSEPIILDLKTVTVD